MFLAIWRTPIITNLSLFGLHRLMRGNICVTVSFSDFAFFHLLRQNPRKLSSNTAPSLIRAQTTLELSVIKYKPGKKFNSNSVPNNSVNLRGNLFRLSGTQATTDTHTNNKSVTGMTNEYPITGFFFLFSKMQRAALK